MDMGFFFFLGFIEQEDGQNVSCSLLLPSSALDSTLSSWSGPHVSQAFQISADWQQRAGKSPAVSHNE